MKMLSLFFLFLVTVLVGEEPNPWLGKKVPQLILENGKTYTNVTFTKIEPDVVTFTHEAGIMRIPMESLKAESREALGYDPDKAVAVRKAKATAYEAEMAARAEMAEQAEMDAAIRTVSFEIIQVTTAGLIVKKMKIEEESGLWLTADTLFVHMETSDYRVHDGMRLEIDAYPLADPYQYTTVLGATKTLPAWQHSPTD